MPDQLPDRRTRNASLNQPRLLIEPPQRTKFFFPSQFRIMNGGLQDAYCLVVNPQRHCTNEKLAGSAKRYGTP